MADDCGDFFLSRYGQIDAQLGWRRHRVALRLMDALFDQRLRLSGALRRSAKWAAGVERQSVLVAAVDVPGRGAELRRVAAEVATSRHAVELTFAPMGQAGKFDNINTALIEKSLSSYDWLLIVDDDIALPRGFLDLLIGEAIRRGFKLAQPAHRFLSYATFEITERHWATVARRTGFVECGPVSLFHRDTFSDLIPFPSLRWSWGLDLCWAEVARQRGWPIGVIDVASIRHLRPVASSYDGAAAMEEAIRFLAGRGIAPHRKDVFKSFELYRR
jgi:hypothetical protein